MVITDPRTGAVLSAGPFHISEGETCYQIVLRSQRDAGEMSIASAARALSAGGIAWPGLQGPRDGRDEQRAIADRLLLRAWRELGWMK